MYRKSDTGRSERLEKGPVTVVHGAEGKRKESPKLWGAWWLRGNMTEPSESGLGV